MDRLTTVKAANDFYGDVHYQRQGNAETTLCGLKVTGSTVSAEATCMRCRQFAAGDF